MHTPFLSLIRLSLPLLAACAANGRVDLGGSDQETPAGTSEHAARVEGRVAAEGAAAVTANDAVTGEALGSGEVTGDGSFAFDGIASSGPVLVTATAADGSFVASVIVDGGLTGDATTTTAPMDAETTLEAETLLAIHAGGTAFDAVDTVDLRDRIDAELAAAVAASADAEAAVTALARAEVAATAAIDASLAASGSDFDAAARMGSSLDARAALDAALDAGTEAEAGADYVADLTEAWADAGVSAAAAADASAAASMAFAASVAALSDEDALVRAAGFSGGALDAAFSAEAVVAALIAADAGAGLVDRARSEGDAFVAAVLSGDAEAEAWATWTAALVGEGDVDGSILGDALAVDAVSSLAAELLVEASAAAAAEMSATLHDEVRAAYEAGLGSETAGSASLAGQVSWWAWAGFRADVTSDVETVASFFADGASGAADLLVQAEGHGTLSH